MKKFFSLLVSLFIAFPAYAGSPVIWGPSGAQNISSGPLYDNSIPYIKQPQTNYISNQSGRIDTTGWGVSGAVTVTRVTSSLPRATTVGAGLSLAAGAVNDYAYYCFTVDDADKNKVIQWSWSQAPGSYTSGDFYAEAYSFTSASCGGSATELALTTDNTSNNTEIPNYTGAFSTSFSTTDASYYGIRYVRKANSSTLVISNVIVGPGFVQSVPAVGTWQSYTPTVTNWAGATPSGFWRRVGDTMEVSVKLAYNSAGPTGSIAVALPSGYTINTAALPDTNFKTVGVATCTESSAGLSDVGIVQVLSSTTVRFLGDDAVGVWNGTVPRTWSATINELHAKFSVPISEWAGSSNYAGSNDVIYVSDDGSADVFGPAGSLVPNQAVGTAVDRDIVFSSPQASNSLQIEYNYAGGGWGPNAMYPMDVQGTKQYGVRGWWVSSTTYRVRFGNGGTTANSATYAQNSSESWADRYTAGDRYRLVYAKAGVATGFGKASQNSLGLVKAGQAPGTNTNDSAETGNVGELQTATLSTNTTTVTADTEVDVTGASLTLGAGHWEVFFSTTIRLENNNTVANAMYARVRVTDSSNNGYSGSVAFVGTNNMDASTNIYFLASKKFDLQLSTSTTIKMRITCNKTDNATGGIARVLISDLGIFTGTDVDGIFYARRVR